MAKGKKYDFNLIQHDASWSAEIVRQITSKKTVVSKSQDGFASEAEAKEWAEAELQTFLQQQIERNKRRAQPIATVLADSEIDSSIDSEEE